MAIDRALLARKEPAIDRDDPVFALEPLRTLCHIANIEADMAYPRLK